MSEAATFARRTIGSVPLPQRSQIRVGTRRNLKFGAALALLAAGAYAALSSQGYVSSDNAVVSAYTVSVRAPISGYVSGLRVTVGDTVKAGTVLASLKESRVDDQRLIDLENLAARVGTDREAYEHEQSQLLSQHAALLARAIERNRFEVAYLNLQATEAERQILLRESAHDNALRDINRKRTLGAKGDAPMADVDSAHATEQQTQFAVDAAVARHGYLRVQAEAAEKGMLLESGSADVAYSSQRADEIEIRLAEIGREITYLAASQAETAGRLDAERQRLDLLRAADLVAPSSGMLWKLGAAEGERLAVSDTAAELVDCQTAFIVATIPQNRYSDVEIGGAAAIRLSGETMDRVGRVVSLTGEATLANDRNLAAAPTLERGATATARVEIARSGNSAGECLVGRTARVLLPTSPNSGWLAGIARRFL
jgi:multidrug resistance efflux pump